MSGVDRLRQRANWDYLFSPELNTCAEKLKRDYLFTGVLPPKDAVCKVDKLPFD